MTDLNALRARVDLIPIVKTLGFRIEGLGEGSARIIAPYESRYDGIFRSYHGGLLMTLADTAACIALLTVEAPDARITTTDMNIRFLAPCRSDPIASAHVIKFGKTLCPVSVEICDRSAARVAIAQVTYMRLGEG